MNLDPATLGVAFLLLSGVLGALLLFAWLLNRSVDALAWWGLAYCLVPFGMGLVSLGQRSPGDLPLLVSNAVMQLAYGLVYAGCRAFNGRPAALWSLPGAVIWMSAFPFIHDWHEARLVVACTVAGGLAGLGAWELARPPRQQLVSRRVAVLLLSALAAFNGFRVLLGLASGTGTWFDVFVLRWSADMGLVLLLFVPSLAFVFLSMAKEHVEFEYREAALVDPLTGIPNRRAFFRNAANLLDRLGDRPATCLLFDLDNFKRINDLHGHETGDRVLSIFGEVLSRHLPGGSYGRIGGEEFGAIVPLDRREAEALADRIRMHLADAAKTVLGRPVDATVSVGCTTAAKADVRQLLQEADAALYRAKAGGRNATAMARSA